MLSVSIRVIKHDLADFKGILAALDVEADNEETAALHKKIIELAHPLSA